MSESCEYKTHQDASTERNFNNFGLVGCGEVVFMIRFLHGIHHQKLGVFIVSLRAFLILNVSDWLFRDLNGLIFDVKDRDNHKASRNYFQKEYFERVTARFA